MIKSLVARSIGKDLSPGHITWGDRAIVLLAAQIARLSKRVVAALFVKLWSHFRRSLYALPFYSISAKPHCVFRWPSDDLEVAV